MDAPNQSAQVIFRLSSSELNGEVNLKPDAWRVLTQVNGVRSLAEIAQNLGMHEATVIGIADTLFKARILEAAPGSAPPPSPSVNSAFFDEIARELARAMGPLASIIVEDEIAALGEKRESFPRDRLADLVERVSAAIKDDHRRLNFQRVMLEAIRKS